MHRAAALLVTSALDRTAGDRSGCGWAVADPRLPADELLRRLTLPVQASAAAGNPALPVAVMHRLLDLARER
ncbi:hypothetical protein [Kitasatospora purpeofusca]|uniref:hypothetical protein n=1 Tax=Kitasatospora purpeofusca TaxID=67352 RepID=UPI00386E63E9|nr:hypothetical protein OIP63_07310 [Kitasatospora purpeofusca]